MSENMVAHDTLVSLTADIVSAHVSNNSVAPNDVGRLIASVHAALQGLDAPGKPEEPKQEPAVSVRASVKPDYLVCLEDGKKLKMLKRYLMTTYNMTPADYRAKWGLPADYPMVAPNYAQQRKELAHKIGLGRKPRAAGASAKTKTAAARGRKRKTDVTEAESGEG
ncbi:MAG: MucR family transcriptional regulator [Sphingobium sp.]